MKDSLAGVFLLFLLTSCSSSPVLDEVREFDERYWLKEDTQVFEFNPGTVEIDTLQVYFNLRNSYNYPYRNLFIRYALLGPSGDTIETEMKEYLLFDEAGKPYGEGIGDIYDHRFDLLTYIHADTGRHKLLLQHYMRPDTLNSILSVGIRIEDNGE